MNKTVNINLAGIFFHIDEDAYLKLQGYLEAIKRSFTDSQGRSEIIADIEARIAELFNERVKHDKQVIRIQEVDDVISIMGQPEDYLVDNDIFEDDSNASFSKKQATTAPRKLFRDTANSYIGGVSSGLGHYFGFDAVWIRLAWVLLIFGAGTGILLYILLWILVPEAKTTAEKIMMTGEPVTISNIEKKIKDSFENVSETVSDVAKNVSDSISGAAKNVSNAAKNVDLKKPANSIKSSSKTFFDTLADIFMFFIKLFAKFIGVILIIVGAITLLSLIIGLLSVGVANVINIPGLDLVDIANAGNTPIWLVSLMCFLAIGIPFFFLFYLGLKILITNLKSIGSFAKFTLLGLWLISIIGLFVVGIRQASEHAFSESYTAKTELPITALDTLSVKMTSNDNYNPHFYKNNHGFKLAFDDNGNKIIYASDIDIQVQSTTDSVATIAIRKRADGRSYELARARAKNIDYGFNFNNNTLSLNAFLTTLPENKFSDQEVDVILYIPKNTVVYFNNSTRSFLYYRSYEDNLISQDDTNHYMKILNNDAECLDCTENDFGVQVDTPKLKIDSNGVEIKSNNAHLKIDSQGVKASSNDMNVNIDSNGIYVKSDNK